MKKDHKNISINKVSKRIKNRIIFFLFSFLFLFSLIVIKLFKIQIVKNHFWQKIGNKLHLKTKKLENSRGKLFDSNFNILATSLKVKSVYLN